MLFYLSGAGAYCAYLIFNLFNDKECPNTDSTSWIVIALASAFWIVVIPISLMEMNSKLKSQDQVENTANLLANEAKTEQIGTTGALS